MDTASPVAVATNAELRLQLLRTPQLWCGGRAVALNRLDAALLALLAHDGPTSRARALALLWPGTDEAAARNLLRQRLFRLRRAAGCELVGASTTRLALPEGMAHDLRDPSAVLLDDPEAAAGELLGDFAYDELSEFRDWLDGARERWRACRREALRALVQRFERQGQPTRAVALAERLIRDEPLHEPAHRALIRLHYLCGDRNAARCALARLRAALARDLGVAPGAETEALAALIETSAALPEPAAAHVAPVATLRPPRLIGRDAAWHTLESSWRDGAPALVLGEAGIGKSRLIDDFARAHGAVRVAARPGDAHVPFALLARLAAELGASSSVPWDAPRLTRALAHRHAAGIVLDDLHFADEASLELLPALLATPPRPWLLAARAHERVAGADWLAELPVQIELAPLAADAVHELLGSLALPGIDARAWSDRVFRHSGGNPFFVLETVRALLEPGTGAWADTELPAPGSLQRLIAARLAKLSPAALKLARVAALAAADFSVDVAAAVLDQHPLDLLDAWRELEAADVVRGQGFAHDLIRQACRAAVPEALRAWLHGRIGAALEAQHAAPGRIAPHARAAGELQRAGTQFRAAADAARAAGRLSEEVRLLATAAECFDELGDRSARFESLARRATAALEALPPAQAMEAAEALVEAAGDDRELGIALRLVGACHLNGARFERAAPELERAIECSERGGDIDSACHARYLLALTVVQTQGAAPALERIESLLEWAETQADIGLRHAFIADLAILLDQADQRRRARPHFERALAHFDAVRAVGDAASTRMMFARSLGLLGDLAQARVLLEAAEREREALSEGGGGQGIEALNLGRVYCELGHYGEALRLLEPTRQRLAEGGASVVGTAIALVIARVLLHLGQGARAQALCTEPGPEAPFHQRATWLWTCALLALERPAERARLLGDAEREFDRTDLPFVRLPIQFDRLGSEATGDAAGAAAIAACRLLVNECERRELPAPQMLGRARLAQLLLAQRELDTAITVVHGLQADLAHCHPVGMYLPELHWICHRVAREAGDAAFAARCLDAAVRWIRDTALPHVPAPYRDSFVRRQPINRRILAAASLL